MKEQIKVRVLIPGSPRGISAERLWATPVEGEPAYFTIDNIPSSAFGLNLGDIVECTTATQDPPLVTRVIGRSGQRTVRVFSDSEVTHEELQLPAGVSTESGMLLGLYILCISIPPHYDLHELLSDWRKKYPGYQFENASSDTKDVN